MACVFEQDICIASAFKADTLYRTSFAVVMSVRLMQREIAIQTEPRN